MHAEIPSKGFFTNKLLTVKLHNKQLENVLKKSLRKGVQYFFY